MYRHAIFYLAFFYLLCEVSINSAAVIGKNTTNSKINTRNSGVSLRITKRQNTTLYITTRLGEDGTVKNEACKCSLFYTCNAANSFEIPDNPSPCQKNYVCCLVETPIDLGDISVDPTSSENVTPDTTTDSNTAPDVSCECVASSNCRRSAEDESSGKGLIDPRTTSSCDKKSGQVCCRPQNIIREEDKSSSSNKLKCGERKGIIDVRISAPKFSSSTIFGEYPWMASIWKTNPDSSGNNEDVFVCGASLLSSNIVLTAAHCVKKLDVSSIKVRVGDYDIQAESTADEPVPHQVRSVSVVSIHPKFDSYVLFHDLALIMVSESFDLTNYVSPICTSMYDSEFVGSKIYTTDNCIATGWGKSNPGSGPLSSQLKKVDLSVVPWDQCQEKLKTTRLKEFFVLDKSFICAGGQKGYDTCVGDGGGPLICPLRNNQNQYVQVGVTSWGVGCGDDVPGMYASLEADSEWLTSEYDKYKAS